MRRTTKKKTPKLAGDGLQIANLSVAISQAGSRMEDSAWQHQLDTLVTKILSNSKQAVLDAASDHVFAHHPDAYEILIESIESIATSSRIVFNDQHYDILCIAAPILAWSRFDVPSGVIPEKMLTSLSKNFSDTLLVKQAQVRLLPHVFSIDQLPRNHCDVSSVMLLTAIQHIEKRAVEIMDDLPKTIPFLADSRYLLGVVLVPTGSTVFQWQTTPAPYNILKAKEEALTRWQEKIHADVANLLPGCGFNILLPDSYYFACRESDIQVRPISIRSAVFYLTQTLNIDASEMCAIIGRFGPEDQIGQVDELRIGFALKNAPEIIYGVVWPLYQQEDEVNALLGSINLPLTEQKGEIETLLNDSGIHQVQIMEDVYGLEFCDDCQAPLYVDAEGDLVHPEMPEDTLPEGSIHFH
jgi:hypothetical protein